MEKKQFNILLVDDHALFRHGLKFLLEGLREDIHFLEAESFDQAREAAKEELIAEEGVVATKEQTIDLLLLDFHLPGEISGFQSLRQARLIFPTSTIVVLSSEDDPTIINQCVEYGASGFVPKSSTPEILIAALNLILAGGVYLPPLPTSAQINRDALQKTNSEKEDKRLLFDQLSERQKQVVMSAIQGQPNKIIARELNIAEGTVKAHLSVAFKTLAVRNRTEAVYLAAKLGLSH